MAHVNYIHYNNNQQKADTYTSSKSLIDVAGVKTSNKPIIWNHQNMLTLYTLVNSRQMQNCHTQKFKLHLTSKLCWSKNCCMKQLLKLHLNLSLKIWKPKSKGWLSVKLSHYRLSSYLNYQNSVITLVALGCTFSKIVLSPFKHGLQRYAIRHSQVKPVTYYGMKQLISSAQNRQKAAVTFSWCMCLSRCSSRYARFAWIAVWNGRANFFIATFIFRSLSSAELYTAMHIGRKLKYRITKSATVYLRHYGVKGPTCVLHMTQLPPSHKIIITIITIIIIINL